MPISGQGFVEAAKDPDHSSRGTVRLLVLGVDRNIVDPGPDIVDVGTSAGLADGFADGQFAQRGSEGAPRYNAFAGVGRGRGNLIRDNDAAAAIRFYCQMQQQIREPSTGGGIAQPEVVHPLVGRG